MVFLFFFDTGDERLPVFRFNEMPAKRLALEQAGDARKRLDVRSGNVHWRNQKKEDERRLVVQRVEVNAFPLDPQYAAQFAHVFGFAVRNGDPVSDARTQ